MEFIHRVPNLVSKQFCEDIIEQFEKSNLTGPGHIYTLEDGYVRAKSLPVTDSLFTNIVSTDISVYPGFIEEAEENGEPEWGEFIQYINLKLQIGIDSYIKKFPMMNNLQNFALEGYNIQRYLPGEGFHNWHCENSGYTSTQNRILAFMVYLNDLTDGGGTDFRIQNYTEKAEACKMVIWPAGWTHIHRGQVSETQTKYIITGWYKHIND
jgi:hypothetical protein